MKKVLVLLAIIASFSTSLSAQTATGEISGKVTDSLTGEPLIAVALLIQGQSKGTSTDIEGFYSLKSLTPGTYTVSCRYIGYEIQTKTVTVKAGEKILLNFNLRESAMQLGELVITGHRKVQVAAMAPTRSSVSIQLNQAPGLVRDRKGEEHAIFIENGFVSALDKPLSTFSVDVDRASYSLVRSYIREDEELPPADAVRIEEMINYFSYNYPQPAKDEAVSITTSLTKSPWNNNLLLKIGLKTKSIDLKVAPANNLVFLIDVSGSMMDDNKLPWVKSSLQMLVEQMRPQDRVSIVVYAGYSGLVLPSTPGTEKEKITEAINQLEAGGSTAGGEGIQLAYKVAAENFIKKGNNRIILCTDGDFNVGVTNNEELERIITEKKKTGVYLTVLGFGIGNYKDNRMEMLADKGNGNYGYVDNLREARKLLVTEMGGSLYTVAEDVKLQIEFNPLLVKQYRLIGYENRLLRDEDFNNDSVDAGDMGAGHTVTALYEIVPGRAERTSVDDLKYQQVSVANNAAGDELVTIKFRYKKPGKNKSRLQQVSVKNAATEFAAADTDTRFAALVASFGMLLRNSEYKGAMDYNSLRLLAIDVIQPGSSAEKLELMKMIKAARLIYMTENDDLAELSEEEEEKDMAEVWPDEE